jgi:hypothetical protein
VTTDQKTTVLSDSGSETGAASRAHVLSDAVSLTVHNALTGIYITHQVRYSNVCAAQDEEAGSSNLPTPTQVEASFAAIRRCFLSARASLVRKDGATRTP